jgi:hypothetical protein
VGIVAEYDNTSPHKDSPHANNGNGCEACHGGGAQHNGVGPIPYPNPFAGNGTRCASCHKGPYATNAPTKFADSKHANVAIEENDPCRRCHTNEGAILGMTYGLTGDGDTLENAVYQGAVPLAKEYTAITCGTCHEHGGGLRPVKARDASGNVVNWNPGDSTFANNQFNLCTGCHNLKSYDGSTLLATGDIITWGTGTPVQTLKVGHHEDRWNRVIATTHYNNLDNPLAGGLSGYVIRTNGEKPCFDCHGHEWNTKTGSVTQYDPTDLTHYDGTNETIWTEWAKSAHAGKLLTSKLIYVKVTNTTRSTAQVDSTITTAVEPKPFFEDDWSAAGQQVCQRCHTATGASNYLTNPATYNAANNDFSHLYDAATGRNWRTSSRAATQREMLYCWGCHANVEADKGGLRNPGAMTALYNFNGEKAQFPDVGSSNVCIACHAGRESGESVVSLPTDTFTNVSFKNSHYMAAAGLMYVKVGFTAFTAPTNTIGSSTITYGASLTSTDDGGTISSTHRKLGTTAINGDSHNPSKFVPGYLDADGPCVTCHMSESTAADAQRHHTLAIDANAYDNVCSNCHTAELAEVLTNTNFRTVFLEEQSEIFQDALTLATTVLKNNYHITYDPDTYPYFYDDDNGGAAVKNWTRPLLTTPLSLDDAKKLMGACFNINLLNREPGAFAHARTYVRRLVYDTIDFLDDRAINLSAGATAQAVLPAVYTKGTKAYTGSQSDSTTTLYPGDAGNPTPTSAAMTYLLGWSRSSGAWSTPERP